VNDAQENSRISSEARAIGGSFYLIGATQDGDGDWVTPSGSAIPFSAWHDMQPDDGDVFTSEDCVEINRWADATWNDIRCDASNAFVCEYPD
jgi:hypothetical protein